jgi:energy-coupling factor transport system ATP-binding protein
VQGVNIGEKKVDLNALRQKVGLVFQYPEYQLFEETVDKDVAFGPRNLGLNEEEIAHRVAEALTLVGLNQKEVGARSPFELSGGQRRRVALAGVLAMNPQILILDEPSAGLDPRGRNEVLDLITHIHQEKGCTVIMVSHSMDEVAKVASRVMEMNHGRLAMDGTPREIYVQGEKLKEMGLGVPATVQLAQALRQRGIDAPSDRLTLQEMSQWIIDRAKEARHV